MFVSDDQDGNFDDGHKYMANSDKYSGMIRDEHPSYDILKIYPDAYEQTNTPGGERYEGATAEIARRVEEGALIGTTQGMEENEAGLMKGSSICRPLRGGET